MGEAVGMVRGDGLPAKPGMRGCTADGRAVVGPPLAAHVVLPLRFHPLSLLLPGKRQCIARPAAAQRSACSCCQAYRQGADSG